MGSVTRIDLALRKALEMFDEINGARKSIPQILFLLTDGEQYAGKGVVDEDPVKIAKLLRDKGIVIFAIGIGSAVRQSQLSNIAGSSEKAFLANNFNELVNSDFLKKIKQGTCVGTPNIVQACEGSDLTIDSRGKGIINILEANYGRTSSSVCPGPNDWNTNCNNQKRSLDIVQSRCSSKSFCTVQATSAVFGDPCVGTFKYLEVKYFIEKIKVQKPEFVTTEYVEDVNERVLTQNTMIAKLISLEKAYTVSFKLKPSIYSKGLKSIIHLTIGEDNGQYGERTPAVFFHEDGSGRLTISSAINGDGSYSFNSEPLSLNEWSSIRISQIRHKKIFKFIVHINGKVVHSIKNTKPQSFKNVAVYAADPWHDAQYGFLKDLRILNGNIEQIIEDRETALVQKNLLAFIPKLDSIYKIYFDVKPNLFTAGLHNIIHFTVDSNMKNYGDGVPGVWFHSSGDGSLHISASINGNLNRVFKTAPVTLKEWSHVEISQQLVNNAYIYTIKLNGENVLSEENNQARSYDNVMVFASDPWYPAQDGSIKDLTIINGKSGPDCAVTVDVGFLLDSSGSLIREYPQEKEFLKSLASTFKISNNGAHAGVVTFSSQAVLSIKLNKYFDQTLFNNSVDDIKHFNGGTRIDLALEKSLEMFDELNGARKNVPQILFLLTDGEQFPIDDVIAKNLEELAKRVRDRGIIIFAIGIGIGVKMSQLVSITDSNDKAFLANNFDELINNDFLKRIKEGTCVDAKPLPNVVFVSKEVNKAPEMTFNKNNLIAILKSLEKVYLVSFMLKPNLFLQGLKSVIHLTIGQDKDQYGDRTPAVFFHEDGSGKMIIASAISDKVDSFFTSDPLPPNKWSSIRISQVLLNGVYTFTVHINGYIVHSIENTKPQAFQNVKVYTSDPWYDSQDGSIKDLRIINGNAEQIIEDRETALVQKNLLAFIPKLDSIYKIYFDVKPNLFTAGLHNIIHFTVDFNMKNYGDGVPGVWFHSSGDGSLHISASINGNFDQVFKTAPVTLKEWSHVEISQQLVSNAYIYTIKLNGKKVYSVENQQATSFDNVMIYASDPWYPAQDGSIKDLTIINGKSESDCAVTVDVGFILDSSGSLKDDYGQEKEFLKSLARTFKISSNGAHAGVVTFSSQAELSIKLNQYFDQNQFEQDIDKIGHMNRFTRIDLALKKAFEMFDEKNGGRKSISQILFLLTDGKQYAGRPPVSNLPVLNPEDEAKILRDRGIIIFAIGIGPRVDESELTKITGSIDKVFLAKNFNELSNNDFLKKIKEGTCVDAKPLPNVVFVSKEVNKAPEMTFNKNNLIAILKSLEKVYLVSFMLKPNLFLQGLKSVIHLTIGQDKDQYGDRTPAVFFHEDGSGKMIIASAISDKVDSFFTSDPLPPNKWSSIRISQVLLNGVYTFTVHINGYIVHSIENTKPQAFQNVKVYTSDPWYDSQDGSIKDLRIINGNAEQMIEDIEMGLVQKNLVAFIPKLDSSYRIYFDVKPTSISSGFHNVIHFTIDSDNSKYGDRIPGVWFHSSDDSSLFISSALNGNLDRVFITKPVILKEWSHVEISQQLVNNAYIYTIKLNGEKVFSEENKQAKSFDNVIVYASDPWYPAQDGSIKDLTIINGKSDSKPLPNVVLATKDYVEKAHEMIFNKNNLIAILKSLEKVYSVSFMLKPNLYSQGLKSVIHLTIGQDKDQYGDRIPAVFFHEDGSGKMIIASAISDKVDSFFTSDPLPPNKWSSIRISQIRLNGIYTFTVHINGYIVHSIENTKPQSFHNVKVYASDPWYDSQGGSIKDLLIVNGNVEQLIGNKETVLVKQNLVAVIPRLDSIYKIYFDVKPFSFSAGLHSVIHFTVGFDNSKYGDRVPGVWFYGSGDGSLYISSALNGNLDRVFITKPVTLKEWSHVEISQQLINNVYMYTIKLNGENVFSEENKQAKFFNNVMVYVSDPWYPAQDGLIKEFYMINGKPDDESVANAIFVTKDVVEFSSEEKLKKNNLIATLTSLGKAYTITFKLKPNLYSFGWKSVIHLTIKENNGQYGDRNPGVWFQEDGSGRLNIYSAVNGNPNYNITTEPLALNEWSNIKISQTRLNSIYIFQVYINGKMIHSIENTKPQLFKNVKVYTSDPWYDAQDGSIKDLRILNGNVEQLIEDTETRFIKNHLVAVIPKLNNIYKIYFDVKPNSFSAGFHNVLHFTIGSDMKKYGDRVPGVWFHESGDGSLHISAPISGNLDRVFRTKPVTLNEWSHIEISQLLENSIYKYSIKLNGEEVFAEENKEPKSFNNVMVYASDPWYPAQNGSIKDLTIVNGKSEDESLPNAVFVTTDVIDFSSEIILKKDNIIATLSSLEKAYSITFKLKPNSYSSELRNVVHMTNRKNNGKYGDRIPGIWFLEDGSGRLNIYSAVNGNPTYNITTEPLALNEWSSIKIWQTRLNGIYTFQVYINGKIIHSIENTYPQSFKNVKVYTSDPWYNAQDGSIKDLRIVNGNAEELIEDTETRILKKNIVAIIPKLDSIYKIYFGVKPNSFTAGFHNVLHFTIGSDMKKYGDRVPGVWFHESGDGSLHISAPINGNLNRVFKTEPVTLNEWSHIEISQLLENNIYKYSIKLNGEEVFAEENREPKSFNNVMVYASDPWYPAQDGFIKDLTILNGKSDDESLPSAVFVTKDVVEFSSEEILKKNNLIAMLTSLDIAYTITFKLKPSSYSSGWKSVIHLTIKGNNGQYGDRNPGVWFLEDGSGRLNIYSAVNGNPNYNITTEPLALNEWSSIKISQTVLNGTYTFQVFINGKTIHSVKNFKPQSFKNVKVYTSDPWYDAQNGSIKDLRILNGNVEQLVEDTETTLVQNTMVAVIPKLDNVYKIYFDVKPYSFTAGFHNVIHFTTGSDMEKYGDRVPGVWFHESGDGSLHISAPISGNLDRVFRTKPVTLNEWSHIEISQLLENNIYKYSIKLNGEEVFAEENKEPKSFNNVMVYTSDPWYPAQNGSIKDLTIVNGKSDNQSMPNVLFLTKEFVELSSKVILKKDNLIAVLSSLEKAYSISFKLKPSLYSQGLKNVIHLTIGQNLGLYGERTPAVFFLQDGSGKLIIASAISNNSNYTFDSEPLPLNEWSSIKISQIRYNGIYTFTAYINGKIIHTVENTKPQSFQNVKVYTSDPWYDAQDGFIKDLRIVNGNIEQLIEDKETSLVSKNMVAVIPRLDTSYKISFDVKPNSFATGLHNVIHFTIGSDMSKYGDRTPGVWFNKSGDGSLYIGASLNGNLNQVFQTASIILNKWTRVEIGQQLKNSSYIYTIKLNGEEVFSEENTVTKSFDDVMVYASDPWYPAQDGLIKDLTIINGKTDDESLPNVVLVTKDYVEITSETILKKDNLIATLPFLEKVYLVAFKIKPTLYSQGLKSVIHLTIGSDVGQYGERSPAVFFYQDGSGKLTIASAVNGNANYNFNSEPLTINEWSNIRISQVRRNGVYTFMVKVNEKIIHSIENNKPQSFENVKVYTSDPWYDAQDGTIKDLRIVNGNVEQLIEDRETHLIQKNMVAVIPKLDNTYKVYFDVKPNLFSVGWHNVIHFTTGSDMSKYGDRVPGVWFHNSGDGSLHIAASINGNINRVFKTEPVGLKEWSHIEIAQQLENNIYIYTIKLNGEEVFAEENTQPKLFDNVIVYVSDPWYPAQDGSIKDLCIVNGKSDDESLPNVVFVTQDVIDFPSEEILKKDNLIATLSTLEKVYTITFKLKPISYTPGLKSVIHLTIKENIGQYGDRSPAVFTHEDGSGRLVIACAINGNYSYNINSEPLPLNEWSNIKIAQVKYNGAYIFSVNINGKVIESIKNTRPQSFNNIKVYTSDPWYDAQDGFIKDLRVVNGNDDLFLPNTIKDLLQEHQAEESAQNIYPFGVIDEGDIKITNLFRELKDGKKPNFWSQSDYHWNHTAVPYKINSDTNLNLKSPDCVGIVDVGFILDSSGSLAKEYPQEKEFLINLVSTFGINPSGAHAAVVTFSSDAVLSIKLNDYFEQAPFNKSVYEIEHMNGWTRIDLALRKSLEIFEEINGARKNVPRLLFLLTDGKQETNDDGAEDPVNVAQLLRDRGVEIVAVGIGKGVNHLELNNIAGSSDKVFLAENFDELVKQDFLKKIKEGTCLGNTENEFKLYKSNLLATLSVIEEEFIISFEIKPTLYSPGLHSVFRIELENDKFIAVWFSEDGSGTLVIKSVFGTIDDEVKSSNSILLLAWTPIKLYQQRLLDKYIYTIEIGGETLFSKENMKSKSFSSVAVYAGDQYNLPQDALVRSLIIKNGNEGFIVKQEKLLMEKAIITSLPKLEKEFVLSFEVQFNSVQDLYYNVIKFSGSSVSSIYPGFWFHKSRNSTMLTASTMTNNKLVSIDQNPVAFDMWNKVVLSQTFNGGSYTYYIHLNDVEVYSEKITPVVLNTVMVYASSPEYTAQAGLIRNFKIALGKKGTAHLENPSCEGFFDVGFILDSSGSLESNYSQEIDFLKQLASSFGISKQGSHAGVVTFSSEAKLSIQLDKYFTDADFNKAVDDIPYMGGGTRIDLALEKAIELFDTRKGSRNEAPKLLFLLTDGVQDPKMDIPVPNEIKQKTIQLFAVGVGSNVSKNELLKVVGNHENVFLVEDFNKLVQSDFLKKVKQGSCSSVLENLQNEIEIKKNNLLVTLWFKKEFIVSFDIKPTAYLPGYHSVLKLEIENGKYISVWFSELGVGTLMISSLFGTINNEVEYKNAIPLNEWTSIKISQQFLNFNYIYTIEIGEDVVLIKENGISEEFRNVDVYVSESDHLSQSGFIRNLKIKNGNEGYILREETPIEQGKLLATIPKLELEYRISFEVNLENKEKFLNVFQITHSGTGGIGGPGGIGNEILAMWLDEERIGKLTSENNNFAINFPNQMPVKKWMTVRISQQFFNKKYLCEVNLNGEEILSREYWYAKSYNDLTFYATSLYHNSASGSIRNIQLINGHIDVELRKVVKAAIKDFHDFTCIKFVPYDNQNDYLSFVAKEGCYSEIGMVGEEQKISIGPECRWKGTTIHLIMHSLGFLHETSRVDRDTAIKVIESNVEPKFINNFQTYDADQMLGLQYDYFSIMHYGPLAFSKNRRSTLMPLFPNIELDMIGQRDGFSEFDIKRIKEAYKCGHNIDSSTPPLSTPSPSSTETTSTPTTNAPPSKPQGHAPGILITTLPPLISTPPPPPPPTTTTITTTTTPSTTTKLTSAIKPTSAISIHHSVTPTKVKIVTHKPCKQIYYPCWPYDFSILHQVPRPCCLGLNFPQNCQCYCTLLNSQKLKGKSQDNYLCHKRSFKNPGFLVTDDKHPLKKCIRLPSASKKFLCYSHESGYQFHWSDLTSLHSGSCIRSMGAPLNSPTILCNN
ncbi:uncharacterized protein LOC105845300 isoform X3 [Hydra vulgaris]